MTCILKFIITTLTDKIKMDKIEKARELINKHLYLHGGDGLGITNGDVYRAVLDAVCEALTISSVINSLCDCHQTDKNGREYCRNCEKNWND